MKSIDIYNNSIVIKDNLQICCHSRIAINLASQKEDTFKPLAFELLCLLLYNNGTLCTIDKIISELWDDNKEGATKENVQSHIKSIRATLATIDCTDVLEIKNIPSAKGVYDGGCYSVELDDDAWHYVENSHDAYEEDDQYFGKSRDFDNTQQASQMFQFNHFVNNGMYVNHQTVNHYYEGNGGRKNADR